MQSSITVRVTQYISFLALSSLITSVAQTMEMDALTRLEAKIWNQGVSGVIYSFQNYQVFPRESESENVEEYAIDCAEFSTNFPIVAIIQIRRRI